MDRASIIARVTRSWGRGVGGPHSGWRTAIYSRERHTVRIIWERWPNADVREEATYPLEPDFDWQGA